MKKICFSKIHACSQLFEFLNSFRPILENRESFRFLVTEETGCLPSDSGSEGTLCFMGFLFSLWFIYLFNWVIVKPVSVFPKLWEVESTNDVFSSFAIFADDVQVQLSRHLLKTVCADIVNLAVSLLAAEHMITIKDDSAITPEVLWKDCGCWFCIMQLFSQCSRHILNQWQNWMTF